MLIDTHCHVDQFPSPEKIVRECESNGLRVVAVTNLPSHFALAADRLSQHPLVSAALGMHPMYARHGLRELSAFRRMAPYVDFIGEIGLDFSRAGIASKDTQERVFDEILSAICDRPRFLTLHSRGAEKAVLESLRLHKISAAVFHWFSGSSKVLAELFAEGHFVSINPAMISSATGRRVIAQAPRERVLVESDGPFTKIKGSICTPVDVARVYESLATTWKVPLDEAISDIDANFHRIVQADGVRKDSTGGAST